MKILKLLGFPILPREELNISASVINMAVVLLTGFAVMNDSWVKLQPMHLHRLNYVTKANGTQKFQSLAFSARVIPNGRNCEKMGTLQLLQPSEFDKFYDRFGFEHVTFHTNNGVYIDCITHGIGNIFYVIIVFTSVITMAGMFSSVLCLFSPIEGNVYWIRQNSILEFINLMLTSLTLLASVFIQYMVDNQHPDAYVDIGLGMYLIAAATLLMFASLGSSIKHQNKMRNVRRLQNKKFICSRALRSWRDHNQRPEDMRPILGDEIFDEEPIVTFANTVNGSFENPYFNPVITTENVHSAP